MHYTYGIAAAKSLLSFSAKESNQRELPATPASIKGSAVTSVVLPEPDDADLGRLTEVSAFAFHRCHAEERSIYPPKQCILVSNRFYKNINC